MGCTLANFAPHEKVFWREFSPQKLGCRQTRQKDRFLPTKMARLAVPTYQYYSTCYLFMVCNVRRCFYLLQHSATTIWLQGQLVKKATSKQEKEKEKTRVRSERVTAENEQANVD